MKKTIAFFTSARSEYGTLKPLIELFLKDETFNIKVIAGGGHFSKEQGFTIDEIKADGITVDAAFDTIVESDLISSISLSNANLQNQLAHYLEKKTIDLLIVLGDRTELIAAVSTALFQNIPIAHISGGEITEGAVDNQVRHAVTKMSHIHFPATEEYKKNLLSMGEEEWRICVSGEPGLSIIKTLKLPNKTKFLSNYSLADSPFILMTIHPETISQMITQEYVESVLLFLLEHTQFQLLITAANTDFGGNLINDTIQKLAKEYNQIKFVRSLGKINYYAALSYADLVIGNSSSGLVEAQSFNIPVINIGDRQKGRLANKNVVNVRYSIVEFEKGLIEAISPQFIESIKNIPNIYGDGTAEIKILDFIKNINWSNLNNKKSVFQQ
jgi:GDP/UDP-N,N'-diacetylbacillosamine 2-epimerase (hydrolysing)